MVIIIIIIKKICMLGSARILGKVLSVWTEWLTWVTDALSAWFAPGWCTKRTPAKTMIKEIIIIIIKPKTEVVGKNLQSLSLSRKTANFNWEQKPGKDPSITVLRDIFLHPTLRDWMVYGLQTITSKLISASIHPPRRKQAMSDFPQARFLSLKDTKINGLYEHSPPFHSLSSHLA